MFDISNNKTNGSSLAISSQQDIEMGESNPEDSSTIKAPVLIRYVVCGNVFEVTEKYDLQYAIGEGSYGIVCSAIDTELNEKSAIKKIIGLFEHEFEFQKRILREIKILKHLQHENIISLTDLIPPKSFKEFQDVYIVTDLMETDLRQIIKSDQKLTDRHIQYFLYQILRAMKYIHSANVLHRDLKPSNILINSDCELKICDFGLSRGVDFDNPNPVMSTPYVATRWYRSPELLLQWETASKAIDVWSIGCIFAELLNRKVLFPGKNYLHQIELIVDLLGTPSDEEVKGCQKARAYVKQMKSRPKQKFQDVFQTASRDALDLLEKMLRFDPDARISVDDALKHDYLKSLHDNQDEPNCKLFDYQFESLITKDNIKDAIYQEIMDWNLEQNNVKGDAVIKKMSIVKTISNPPSVDQHK